MFALRRAAVRAVSSHAFAIKPSVQPRSFTTISAILPRLSQSFQLPVSQKRFASDVAIEEQAVSSDQAQELEESAPPETTSAEPYDARDIESIEAREVPLRDTAPTSSQDRGGRSYTDQKNYPPSTQLYIGNLFFDVAEEDIRREFSRYGTTTNLRIIKDAHGNSKGFGYIDFLDQADATAARDALNAQVFEGRRISVQYAQPRNMMYIPRERAKLRRDPAPPSKTLYIGNLDFNLSDQDIGKLFSSIKNITDVRLAIDRRTGAPRGFAHADFTDIESAEQACKLLNDKVVAGRTIRCDFSAPTSRLRTGGEGRD